eukprot:TRINITY_DN1808_c0_g1_i1.p1 TRINITY_DN1808_c0_g1~~TRINITY_DN1808_c0_g1_i1.p1  ORF type:complete len:283 (+),score=73.41 TRINITY_DN1808_c0_g1_i1:108-851(+)
MASTVDTKKRLSDFRVLSFDCYGTLIHWEKGMLEALSKLGWGDVDPKTILSHFADLETAYQQANPTMLYPQILAGVVKQIAERLGRTLTDEQCVAFGKSIGEWPPFPDTPDALRYLSQHYKLVALSNIDRSSFAMSEALMGVKFDLVLTAQDIGSYKPDLNNFNYLLNKVKEVYNIEKSELLHVSCSLYHDVVPASKLNIANAYLTRTGAGAAAPSIDKSTVPHDFEFDQLADLVEQHKQEQLHSKS